MFYFHFETNVLLNSFIDNLGFFKTFKILEFLVLHKFGRKINLN